MVTATRKIFSSRSTSRLIITLDRMLHAFYCFEIELEKRSNTSLLCQSTIFYLSSSQLLDRPKHELSKAELEELEEFEFKHGPMSLINDAMITKIPVIISLRNNHKIIARVKAFDRHCNMVLENVKELWTEKKGKSVINRERFISKLFLRGDSVIVVLKTPVE